MENESSEAEGHRPIRYPQVNNVCPHAYLRPMEKPRQASKKAFAGGRFRFVHEERIEPVLESWTESLSDG
jgi:hypothetical protein